MSDFPIPLLAISVTPDSPEWISGHRELAEGLEEYLRGGTVTTNWQTHGMVDDEEEVMEAAEILGLLPDEVEALVEHSRFQKDLHLQLAKHHLTQERDARHKHREIANYYERRARRFKELEAALDKTLTDSDEYREEMES